MERDHTERPAPEDGLAGAQDVHVTRLDGRAPATSARDWRWSLRLGGAIALLGLIAVVAVALSPLLPRSVLRSGPPAKNLSLSITAIQLPDAARSCLNGMAWSADSARIALVRDSFCDSRATSDPNDPTALIFNAATGKLENGFDLDRMLAPPNAQVTMDGVAWMDAAHIAVLFTVFTTNRAGNLAPSGNGVALLTVRGASAGALIAATDYPVERAGSDTLSSGNHYSVAEWDMRQGALSRRTLNLTPASAYRWNGDGALDPVTLSGNPTGSADTVSIWGSGLLTLANTGVCAASAPNPPARPYLYLTLATLAWSPTHAYLANLSVSGRYPPPLRWGPGAPSGWDGCGQGPATENAQPAPAPDAGLRAVEPLLTSGENAFISLAWRPDGRRLAALTFNVAGAGSAILIYDCRTGRRLRHYTSAQIPLSGQPGTGPAKNFDTIFTAGAWSPDGRSLLIQATGTGALPFIIGARAL
ncbi:MAG TPA: hypothetical protein VF808_03370 [Ktedonobacterales bacterium]